MPFTLERRTNDLVFRRACLDSRTALSPDYVRLRLVGEELRGFDSPGADDHIRIFLPDAPIGSEMPEPDAFRAFPSREYTPLAWDAEAGALEIEFLLHGAAEREAGDHGIAARWAATAPLGSPVAVGGPRGSMVLNGRPDAWFLAGDETALPAIRRFTGLMPADAVGRVVVEVSAAGHELDLETPAGIEVAWLHRHGRTPRLGEALAEIGAEARPAGDVFGFVAAEQHIVKPGRALLHERWGLDPEQTVVKGYWKQGDTEYHAAH